MTINKKSDPITDVNVTPGTHPGLGILAHITPASEQIRGELRFYTEIQVAKARGDVTVVIQDNAKLQ